MRAFLSGLSTDIIQIMTKFFNRDASGMTLEMEAIEISLATLAPSGWAPGIAYDPEADKELMEEDKVEAEKREERKKRSGFFSCKYIVNQTAHMCSHHADSSESINKMQSTCRGKFATRDHFMSQVEQFESPGEVPGCGADRRIHSWLLTADRLSRQTVATDDLVERR